MDVEYGNKDIILQTDNVIMGEMEKAYLKQFDSGTVKYVSGQEGSKLMISMSE